jgi:hypothetical protein
MTPIAPDDSLRELDADLRRAWVHYGERVRELHGSEYERVEPESWEELQGELARVAERRHELAASDEDGSTGTGPRSDAGPTDRGRNWPRP